MRKNVQQKVAIFAKWLVDRLINQSTQTRRLAKVCCSRYMN
jgi:hypothetical protein